MIKLTEQDRTQDQHTIIMNITDDQQQQVITELRREMLSPTEIAHLTKVPRTSIYHIGERAGIPMSEYYSGRVQPKIRKKNEKAILALCEKNPDISVDELVEKTKFKKSVVRLCLASLEKSGKISAVKSRYEIKRITGMQIGIQLSCYLYEQKNLLIEEIAPVLGKASITVRRYIVNQGIFIKSKKYMGESYQEIWEMLDAHFSQDDNEVTSKNVSKFSKTIRASNRTITELVVTRTCNDYLVLHVDMTLHSDMIRSQLVSMYEAGESVQKISDETGITPYGVFAYLVENDLYQYVALSEEMQVYLDTWRMLNIHFLDKDESVTNKTVTEVIHTHLEEDDKPEIQDIVVDYVTLQNANICSQLNEMCRDGRSIQEIAESTGVTVQGVFVYLVENGEYRNTDTPSTKPWRALLRVVSNDEEYIQIVIPSWETERVVSVSKSIVPANVLSVIENKEDGVVFRLHAWVNIGGENADELMFSDWELK